MALKKAYTYLQYIFRDSCKLKSNFIFVPIVLSVHIMLFSIVRITMTGNFFLQ